MTRFEFDFDRSYRAAGLPFGVMPSTTQVEVSQDDVRVRFGPWRLTTPLTNLSAASLTGGYKFIKTAGPPHLSFSDRGVTFATNGRSGLCVQFIEPVAGIDPTRRILHPGATVTVAEPEALLAALQAHLKG